MQVKVERRNRTTYAFSTDIVINDAVNRFERVYIRDVYDFSEEDFLSANIPAFVELAEAEMAVQQAQLQEIVDFKVYNFEDGVLSEVS